MHTAPSKAEQILLSAQSVKQQNMYTHFIHMHTYTDAYIHT